MSKMSDLYITIIEMLEEGYVATEVAEKLNVPLIWVNDIMEDYYYDHEEYYEPCTM